MRDSTVFRALCACLLLALSPLIVAQTPQAPPVELEAATPTPTPAPTPTPTPTPAPTPAATAPLTEKGATSEPAPLVAMPPADASAAEAPTIERIEPPTPTPAVEAVAPVRLDAEPATTPAPAAQGTAATVEEEAAELGLPVSAPTDLPTMQEQSVQPSVVIDPQDLSAFVDGVVESLMRSESVSGVTVAVVNRDGPLLLRGYGMASFDPDVAVDPLNTLFRIGSVSKTFTYFAAMQLSERGLLDLDAEINDYLPDDLKIADPGSLGPIHVWHLMTHTAGFEDSALGHLILREGDTVLAPDEYLKRYRPERVRSPGARAVYSNYSVALLGKIVALRAGAPFEDVAKNQILEPLGMAHTTFREKLPEGDPRRAPDALLNDWATGHKRENGGFVGKRFEHIVHAAAAGGASSTASDMGRFMRMLLRRGELDGARVLSEATFDQMATVRFRNADAVSGFAHGFFATPVGELTSLGHGGATLDMMTAMAVLPEAGIGVFVSANSSNSRKLVAQLPSMVFQRYVEKARPGPVPKPDPSLLEQADRFTGSYVNLRRNETTMERLFNSLDAIKVAIDDQGVMRVTVGDDTRRYVRESELTFRAVESDDHIAFLVDGSGRATNFVAGSGHWVAERLSWWNHPQVLMSLLAAVFAFSLLVPLVAWARWSGRRGYATAMPPGGRLPATMLLLACVGWLGFFVVALLAGREIGSMGDDIVQRYPTDLLRHAVLAAQIAAGLSLLALLTLPLAWTARWGFFRRLRHSIVVLTMIAACAALWYWNVLLAPLGIGVSG